VHDQGPATGWKALFQPVASVAAAGDASAATNEGKRTRLGRQMLLATSTKRSVARCNENFNIT